jgi:hypothetical protein
MSGAKQLPPAMAGTLRAIVALDSGEGAETSAIAKSLGIGVRNLRQRLGKLRRVGLVRVAGWGSVRQRWSAAPRPAVSSWRPNWQKPQPDHRPAMRKCLGDCAAQFLSAGPGNRICPACTGVNATRGGGLDDAAGATW